MIAQDVTFQFTAGWDWQQPVRDRNTGIWDDVVVRYTGPVLLRDVHAAVYRAHGDVPLSETAAVRLQLGLTCTGLQLPGQTLDPLRACLVLRGYTGLLRADLAWLGLWLQHHGRQCLRSSASCCQAAPQAPVAAAAAPPGVTARAQVARMCSIFRRRGALACDSTYTAVHTSTASRRCCGRCKLGGVHSASSAAGP